MKLMGDIFHKGYRSFYSSAEREAKGIKVGTPSRQRNDTVHDRRCKESDNQDIMSQGFGSSRFNSRTSQYKPKADWPGNTNLSLLKT